jgi:DNA topoisomerase-1
MTATSASPAGPAAPDLAPPDPAEAARFAGLRYVSDARPGIRRRRSGRGFTYASPTGERITDPDRLAWIRALAIPPAWTDVWICPDPRGHLQATGRDAKGRKQYRYHGDWRATRDETKFDRMQAFAHALPILRRRARADLGRPGLPREKVLATLVQLLERSLIRVGNEEYAKQNDSFGLTTMRVKHVRVTGGTVHFQFRGKSGKHHTIDVNDWQLAHVVKQCRDLPGQELFQYLDADGKRQRVGSGDLNAYLREVTGEEFTSKDFRTWWGTVLAVKALRELPPGRSKTHCEKNVLLAIEAVAGLLGNTRSVCRKSYVHPGVVDCYVDGSLAKILSRASTKGPSGLRPDEVALLAILKHLPRKEPAKRTAA